ncbi:MAG: amidohydrolase family protein [Actinobacteria bacterium]|nr:amidohydrolase family protein [Actinomycetota bacterium]
MCFFLPFLRYTHFLGGEADSIPELIKAVRLRKKRGCESIKIIVTGGQMTSRSLPERISYTIEEIKTVVDTATHLSMTTFAHCLTTEGFVKSMEGNIGCIEHCACFVLAKNGLLERVWEEKVMNQFKGKQQFFMGGLSSGLHSFDDIRSGKRKPNEKEIFWLEQEARLFKNFIKLVELGMRPVVGTDAGVTLTTFDETWFELELMVKAGLSPLDALKAATINGAECLEMEDAIGKIDIGYSADLIAANENPLKNISTLKNVEWVMHEGEIVSTVKNNMKKYEK